jgi:hypothetical protein
VGHIHRHVIKGWTTDVTSRHRYKNESIETERSPEEVESQKDWEQTTERGTHIYKHVVKGWTMDPHANDGFERNLNRAQLKEKTNVWSEPKNREDDVAIYR